MTYKTHPLNTKPSTLESINCTLVQYVEGKQCTVPIKTVKIEMDDSLPAYTGKYTVPPPDRFIEYEESDMDWLVFFGMALGIKTIVFEKPLGTVMTVDGSVDKRFIKEEIDANYSN